MTNFMSSWKLIDRRHKFMTNWKYWFVIKFVFKELRSGCTNHFYYLLSNKILVLFSELTLHCICLFLNHGLIWISKLTVVFICWVLYIMFFPFELLFKTTKMKKGKKRLDIVFWFFWILLEVDIVHIEIISINTQKFI